MAFPIKIFVTLFMAVFVTAMGAGFVAPLLPVYAHELGAGTFQIGLIFGAFSVTRTLFVPYFGALSDIKGKKPFLTWGLLLYCILSIFFSLAHNVWALVGLRLGQGFASAMIFPVAQAYVGEITPAGKEGRIMGLFNISLYAGLSAGPVLGGMLKDWIHIEASFLTMGALALTGFSFCLLLLPREKTGKRDASLRPKKPVSYRQLARVPSVLSLFVFRACFTTCIGITWAFLPLFASTRLGLSSSAIGIVVMINVLLAGILQIPMGYCADRFSKKALIISGGFLGVTAMLFMDGASSFRELFLVNAALGAAGGISFPAIMAAGVIEGRRNKAMGSVMGILALSHSVGMLAGPMLAGIFLDSSSFKTIFQIGAAVMGAGTIVFWRKGLTSEGAGH